MTLYALIHSRSFLPYEVTVWLDLKVYIAEGGTFEFNEILIQDSDAKVFDS